METELQTVLRVIIGLQNLEWIEPVCKIVLSVIEVHEVLFFCLFFKFDGHVWY